MEGVAQGHPLAGWIPWKVVDPGPALAWLPLDGEPFHEPFFQESLLRLKARGPVFMRTWTSPELLDADLAGLERLEPALLVFHVSRCGSTLLTQMLGLDPANVVLSEPPLLDHLLRQGQDGRVQPLLTLLGQKRFPESTRLILKLDSWHLAFHGRLRALFPDIPFVLLYREPARIISSQRKARGMHALPGVLEPSIFGFRHEQLPPPEQFPDGWSYLDAYLERVLDRYFEWMEGIARRDGNSLLLDFEEGPGACYQRTLSFANLDPGEAIRAAAVERCAFHGKRPWEVHQEPPGLDPAPVHLQEAYGRLGALREVLSSGEHHER
jgi:hypothetical protein